MLFSKQTTFSWEILTDLEADGSAEVFSVMPGGFASSTVVECIVMAEIGRKNAVTE